MKKKRNQFESISPIDYRYWDKEVAEYLSEEGFLRYKLLVEKTLVKVLHRRGLCSKSIAREIEHACRIVTPEEVYKEEERIRHDIRALVNVIRSKVSDAAKPYVHMTATSYDIIDSANALRFKEVVQHVLTLALTKLEKCSLGSFAEKQRPYKSAGHMVSMRCPLHSALRLRVM